MSYWDQDAAKLAFVMTDEMNSEGNGSFAQHQVIAMAWEMGFRYARTHHTLKPAEELLQDVLNECPWAKKILTELKAPKSARKPSLPESLPEDGA